MIKNLEKKCKNFPYQFMFSVWGVISPEGFEHLVWLEQNVNSDYYIERILSKYVINN